MNNAERCDNCRFHRIIKDAPITRQAGLVACCRHPPGSLGFSHVDCDNWCGEWQAVDAPEPTTVKSPPC